MKKLSLLFGILEPKIQIWDVFPRSAEQGFLTVRARLAQYEPKAQQGTKKKPLCKKGPKKNKTTRLIINLFFFKFFFLSTVVNYKVFVVLNLDVFKFSCYH